MKKFLYRFLPLFSVVVIFICSINFPVFAASKNFLDYNDYITNVTVDGDYDLCQWEFPVSMYSSDIYNETGRYYNSINSSNVASASFYANNSYRISFYSPHFLIGNIPIDTTIYTWFFLDSTNYIGSDYATLNVGVSYFDKEGNFIKQINNTMKEMPFGSGSYVDTVIRKDIPNAYGVQIFYQFNYFVASVSTQCTITLESSVFEASISSVYRQSQANAKTNRLLEEVSKQLESNGQKLDGIINGTPDQNAAADQFNDKVDNITGELDEAGDQLDSVEKPTISVEDVVPTDILAGEAYAKLVSVLSKFWESDILVSIATVLGSLILISYAFFGEKG